MKELSLYIHIPFCVKKCLYCDFLSAPATDAAREQYLRALRYEIEARSEDFKDREVISVFLGGGTPSILNISELEAIFDKIKSYYNLRKDCEITIEVNPGTVWKKETFEEYRRLGINRLSIGLQSANDDELKLLGRIHSFKDFEVTYKAARDAGFDNINIDIISALPGQKEEDYLNTLNTVIKLNPEHISAYSLIIEPGTAFYEDYKYLITDEEHE
ncbi:MAG: radical SAM family heme chaperone HemW, partial [Lachnospiraceae bacterium]|nr:radical SAM family heme chaperone HemW [Lachnospiraceae bacterium]